MTATQPIGFPRSAIARVKAGGSQGTGFAVARDRVATCLHVVADRKGRPIAPRGPITVQFPGHGAVEATLVAHDVAFDWAILACAVPAAVAPVVVRPAVAGGALDRPWWTYGYPDLNAVDGSTAAGAIRNLAGSYGGVAAIELYSEELKATPVHGHSGSPLFDGDDPARDTVVIGIIRATLEEDERSFGKLYATAAAHLLASTHVPRDEAAPYQGLHAFSEERAAFFFGRDREIGELVRTLGARAAAGQPRLLTLVGASGSGKSSLARAGVIPAIQAGRLAPGTCRVLTMRPGPRPLDALAAQLAAVSTEEPRPDVAALRTELATGGEALARLAARHLGGGGLGVVLVDQLEELFGDGSAEGRAAPAGSATAAGDDAAARQRAAHAERELFLGLLVEAARAPGPIWVVTTLRSDFLGPLRESQYEPDLRGAATLVGSVDASQLRAVITEPARRVGLGLEDALVDRLIAESRSSRNDLPLLQFALDRLWRERRTSTLTLDDFEKMGGFEGAIARRADEVYAALPAVQQARVERLFRALVRVGDAGAPDTRRRASKAELARLDAGYRDALAPFVAERLLVVDEDSVEIAHEAVIGEWARLRAWLAVDRARTLAEQELADALAAWERGGRADDLLLAPRLLRRVLDVLADRVAELDPAARGFLLRSAVVDGDAVPLAVPRVAPADLIALLDEIVAAGQHTDAIAILRAAGPARADTLGALERLLAIVALRRAPGAGPDAHALAESAALAIGALGLTAALVERAGPRSIPRAVRDALATLRNVDGDGVVLDGQLRGPARRAVRRTAALQLLRRHLPSIVVVVLGAYLASFVFNWVFGSIAVNLGEDGGSLHYSPLDLAAACGAGAYVLLRRRLDHRRVDAGAVVFIAAATFVVGDGLRALTAIPAAFERENGVGAIASDVIEPWLSALTALAIAAVFAGDPTRRWSRWRVVAIALLGAGVTFVLWGFLWRWCFDLLRHGTTMWVEPGRLVLRLVNDTFHVAIVVLVVRELIFLRDHAARRIAGLAGGAAVLFALIHATVVPPAVQAAEERFLAGHERLSRARNLIEDGHATRGERLLRAACRDHDAEGCRALSDRLRERGRHADAVAAAREACRLRQTTCAIMFLVLEEARQQGVDVAGQVREACETGSVRYCLQAAEQEPRRSDERARWLAQAAEHALRAVAPVDPALRDDTGRDEVVRAVVDELRAHDGGRVPGGLVAAAGELCNAGVGEPCWVLARAIAASDQRDDAREADLVARACRAGVVVACGEQAPVAAAGAADAVDAALLEDCVNGGDACARASPATRRAAAQRIWDRGELGYALSQWQRECEAGDPLACQAWSEHAVRVIALRQERAAVPDAIAARYRSRPDVQLVRILAADGDLPGCVDHDFRARRAACYADLFVEDGALRLRVPASPPGPQWHVWPRLVDWLALDDATLAAQPLAGAAGQAAGDVPYALPTTPGATVLVRLPRLGHDLLVVLHVEEVAADRRSVVIAWREVSAPE